MPKHKHEDWTKEQRAAHEAAQAVLRNATAGLSHRELALRLGVAPQAVNQARHHDSPDFRITTLARYLEAAGYRLVLSYDAL